MKATIYGHEIELTDPDGEGIVTDVLIIARTVRHEPDGQLSDSLSIDATEQTTGMVQHGMVSIAKLLTGSGWGDAE